MLNPEAAIAEPAIKGKWRYEGNEIVCGQLRMRITECDGLSPTKCKRIMAWICKTMNQAAGEHAVDPPLPGSLAYQASQVVERRIAKGRVLKIDGNIRTHRIL